VRAVYYFTWEMGDGSWGTSAKQPRFRIANLGFPMCNPYARHTIKICSEEMRFGWVDVDCSGEE